jgi:hypothetical protein
MKISKKIWVPLLILSLAVIIVGTVWAFGGPARFCPGGFEGLVLDRLDERVEDLGLNEDQTRTYGALREQFKVNLRAGADKRRAMIVELNQALAQENPDIRALNAEVKARLEEVPGMLSANLDLLADFYDILDQEQKDKFLQKARRRLQRVVSYTTPE